MHQPYFYDLHIHTCLSPCGDDRMTPSLAAGFAALAGLQVIAVCDHNSAGNVRAVQQAAGHLAPDLLVIPGIELNTAEEIHMICLFPTAEAAEAAGEELYRRLPPIPNRPDIFGHQLLMDAEDNLCGVVEKLLINATDLSVDDVPAFAARYGGFCYPAHIDRETGSILSVLGAIPAHLPFTAVEVKDPAAFFAEEANRIYAERYHIVTDSDAHTPEQLLPEAKNALHLPELSFEALKALLTTPKG